MTTFAIDWPVLSDDPVRIANNGLTTVFNAVGQVAISSIIVTPTTGTPNLTIEIYDASAASIMTLRKAVAMTAGTAFIFNELFTLNPGQTIRVTSSSATGDMDVMVIRAVATAAQTGR